MLLYISDVSIKHIDYCLTLWIKWHHRNNKLGIYQNYYDKKLPTANILEIIKYLITFHWLYFKVSEPDNGSFPEIKNIEKW